MSNRNLIIVLLILTAALIRFVPLPPNFAPIAAMALFGGVFLKNKWLMIGVPVAALFLSDLAFHFFVPAVGFHGTMPFVYTAFALIAFLGYYLRDKLNFLTIAGGSLAGSLLFFVVSNIGVWLMSPMYTLNLQGLIQCFGMAIPFFHYSVAGDLFFNAILFGSAFLVFARFPRLATS